PLSKERKFPLGFPEYYLSLYKKHRFQSRVSYSIDSLLNPDYKYLPSPMKDPGYSGRSSGRRFEVYHRLRCSDPLRQEPLYSKTYTHLRPNHYRAFRPILLISNW